ncbi:DUF6286 domain-containing protein [Mycolicibacterium hodleri]|uniref:DUF6286 domain-containing protein n=1 Tax=Mycolicibacterium hodleri TaxID=49897 RepID=A0A502E989_9MYCO|nr:DUF6286 domain-containing protein [Mycolicibacterium hodleri]TPG33030.1 hypothetical protein EAH80_16620 [Mycolicibacterium hodleri]
MTVNHDCETPGGDARVGTSVSPAAGRAPVAAPTAGYVGALVALLLLAVGAMALRDAAVDWGWLRGAPWITTAISGLDGLTHQVWMLPAGVVAVLLGLWSITAGLRPRRRTALAVSARTSVWIPRADLARLATAAADTVPGVLSAKASASLRTVSVTAVVTTGGDAALDAAINAAVTEALNGFIVDTPRIKVRTRTGED